MKSEDFFYRCVIFTSSRCSVLFKFCADVKDTSLGKLRSEEKSSISTQKHKLWIHLYLNIPIYCESFCEKKIWVNADVVPKTTMKIQEMSHAQRIGPPENVFL